jgi:hypothetical protein
MRRSTDHANTLGWLVFLALVATQLVVVGGASAAEPDLKPVCDWSKPGVDERPPLCAWLDYGT